MNVVNETVAAVGQLLPVIDSRHVHKDVYQVKVTCSQLGETRVEYRVGNAATSTNMNPVEALTHISVSNYYWLTQQEPQLDAFSLKIII